ncbi:MAG TPA: GreA/GreB family elongation factor [Caulobacteraceae bacterium]|nr:GreA/GreB family elongation factor [Caulobacteraceae bacterium]
MSVQNHQKDRSTIYVAAAQHECLSRLAEHSTTHAARLLRRELDRAVIVSDEDAPRNFVRLDSLVEYDDLLSGKSWSITLVAPQEADIDQNKVSVLTPVGAAVLGLVPGESFSWLTEDGRPRVLVIKRVVNRS